MSNCVGDPEAERHGRSSRPIKRSADPVHPFCPMMTVHPGSDLSIEQLGFALEKAVATDDGRPGR